MVRFYTRNKSRQLKTAPTSCLLFELFEFDQIAVLSKISLP